MTEIGSTLGEEVVAVLEVEVLDGLLTQIVAARDGDRLVETWG